MDEEGAHIPGQSAHPATDRRVHAVFVIVVDHVAHAVRVEEWRDALGAGPEHDHGLEPHVAVGARDPEHRGNAVQREQRLELPHA